jgi:DNA-damage-inducible protein J
VRARIDQRIKDEASDVLAVVGMTPSGAFRMLMVRVAAEKALPFVPLIPNRETVAAMKAARKGALTKVRSADELFDRLNADD